MCSVIFIQGEWRLDNNAFRFLSIPVTYIYPIFAPVPSYSAPIFVIKYRNRNWLKDFPARSVRFHPFGSWHGGCFVEQLLNFHIHTYRHMGRGQDSRVTIPPLSLLDL